MYNPDAPAEYCIQTDAEDSTSRKQNSANNLHNNYLMATKGQPVLASTTAKNWIILLEQSFTTCMPSVTASSIFGLERRCTGVTYTVSVL